MFVHECPSWYSKSNKQGNTVVLCWGYLACYHQEFGQTLMQIHCCKLFDFLFVDGCQYLPGTGTPASFVSTDLLDSWLPKVLEQLRFRGLPLSPSLYEEAIAACATGDQQKEARRLLGKMIAAGYEPSKHLGQKQVGLRYGEGCWVMMCRVEGLSKGTLGALITCGSSTTFLE